MVPVAGSTGPLLDSRGGGVESLAMQHVPATNGSVGSPLRTAICDLFGIEVPICLAGMGGVSMAPLVAAVSNAGGLGIMGAANLAPDGLREEIRKNRRLTNRPLAVDLLTPITELVVH